MDGAPSPPVVSLRYTYDATVVTNRTDGVVLSTVCATENATLTSNANGTFALSIDPTPSTNCTIPPGGESGQCETRYGPYGFVRLTPTSPAPSGYFSSVSRNGTAFSVEYYPLLATVTLDPGGPSATFSPNAADRFRATPLTGNGTPTPGSPRFNWSLSGVGWTFVAPASGAVVNVSAAPGAGVGNLTVTGRLAITGGFLVAPPTSVELLAAATTISSASLNRTVLDLGQSVGVAVLAEGAAGYPYSASVLPGLDESLQPATCSASPALGGTVSVSCSSSLNYTAVGVAQPVVTVSNGFSSAVWQFPDVTVAATPSVTMLPVAPVGYANRTIPIEVSVAAGTGTAPYVEGCLQSGNGSAQCLRSPGPTWTFAPVYSAPGHYTALAWVVDAAGSNQSVSTTIQVVAPLAVTWTGNATVGAVGSPIGLAAVVAGGDLPARAWWNVTGNPAPLAVEPVTSDGPVETTYVPSTVGAVTVSVSVVDGLGTVVRVSRTWTVGAGVATAVVPSGVPADAAVTAGSAFPIAWLALDAAGVAVANFSSPAEIELSISGSNGTAAGWVNASGIGPLASLFPGAFAVPAGAWYNGALNVSVTSRVAGAMRVVLLVEEGRVALGPPTRVLVAPDVDHLRLFQPETVVSDGRTNDTLWQVTDRFGNAAYGATVVVATSFGGSTVRTLVPVLSLPDGGTEVWVNFTAPDASAGTVRVTDLAGALLLPPIAVPAASPWVALGAPVSLALAAAVGGTVAGVAAYRRRRPSRAASVLDASDDERELRRLAEGRATVVDLLRRNGPLDLAELATLWEPSPAPPDLADWVASLVTDGTLAAAVDADGVARFCVAESHRPGTQVVLDVEAFDRAMVRREAERAEWGPDDP